MVVSSLASELPAYNLAFVNITRGYLFNLKWLVHWLVNYQPIISPLWTLPVLFVQSKIGMVVSSLASALPAYNLAFVNITRGLTMLTLGIYPIWVLKSWGSPVVTNGFQSRSHDLDDWKPPWFPITGLDVDLQHDPIFRDHALLKLWYPPVSSNVAGKSPIEKIGGFKFQGKNHLY